ncbi:MAG: hypothetical protein M3162_05130 [Thermoproteota archaeon]|nr:hypothetical protein [Thermoproteota archaeon]
MMLVDFNSFYSYGQSEQLDNNFDEAKSSSDEAISIIDSLKGSSLINSAIGGMDNFSLSLIRNQSNNDSVKIGSINGSFNSDSVESLGNITFSDSEANLDNQTSMQSMGPQSSSLTSQANTNTDTPAPDTIPPSTATTADSPDVGSGDGISETNSPIENRQSLMILPYPMNIPSKDYIPLYSSMPLKISNGNILAKLPCNSDNQPTLRIIGSSSDNSVFPIDLNVFSNFSKQGSMCMYQSIIPDNLSNLLYAPTLTSIYLYNPLDNPIEVPSTTSIFIGIHKLVD